MPVSNRTIAATGVAATIVAAVLASYLTDYLDRAQPAVFVTAVGFGPSLGGQPVEVTDDVISLSGKIDFVPSLKRYELYDKLINYDAKISEIKQELTKALDSLDSRQKLYSTSSLTRGSVEAHPLLANGGVFEECLLRSIENNDIDAPVSNLDLQDDLKHRLPLFDMNESVEEGDTRFIVWKSMGTVEIGVPKIMPEHKRQLIEQYVNSIVDGNLKNLMYYSGNAASRAQTDLSELSSLQDKLRKIIEPASALRAELYFYNNGQRAVTIRPYFGLKVLHSSFKDKIFVLAVTSENKDGTINLT